MKLRKITASLMATALISCAASAVSANALGLNGEQDMPLISITSEYVDMPLKGDIDGDGAVTLKDTAIMKEYLNKQYFTIFDKTLKVCDVNWDGKADEKDIALMPSNLKSTSLVSRIGCPINYRPRNTGDLNSDGIVNIKDLNVLAEYLLNGSDIKIMRIGGAVDKNDINCDYKVDINDYNALKDYILETKIVKKY